MEWTEQRIEMLRRLWGQGQTASQIAVALGGVTRNAVIGKAHRLGLTGRPSPIKRDASGTATPKRRPVPRRAMQPQPKPMMPPLQRAAIRAAPLWLRTRMLLRLARQLVKNSYTGSRAISRSVRPQPSTAVAN